MLKYPVGGRHYIIRTAFRKTAKQSKQSLLGLWEPEEDITSLRNAGNLLTSLTAQCPRRLVSNLLILTLCVPRQSCPSAIHSRPDALSPAQCNAAGQSLCAVHLLHGTAEGFLQRLSWQHCKRVTSPVRNDATKLFADSRHGSRYAASINPSSPFPKSRCTRLWRKWNVSGVRLKL